MSLVLLISAISLILDGVLTNYLPYLVGNLSYFTPLLTVTCCFMIYPLFISNRKKYLIYAFILGIIYDLCYTNLLFFHGILFLLLGFCTLFIYRTFEVTKIRVILYLFLILILYESFFALMIFIFQLVPITFFKLFYKISHSLLLNLLYGAFLTFIIGILPKKYYIKK